MSAKLKESGLGIHLVVSNPGSNVRMKTASKPYIYKEAFVVTVRLRDTGQDVCGGFSPPHRIDTPLRMPNKNHRRMIARSASHWHTEGNTTLFVDAARADRQI